MKRFSAVNYEENSIPPDPINLFKGFDFSTLIVWIIWFTGMYLKYHNIFDDVQMNSISPKGFSVPTSWITLPRKPWLEPWALEPITDELI